MSSKVTFFSPAVDSVFTTSASISSDNVFSFGILTEDAHGPLEVENTVRFREPRHAVFALCMTCAGMSP